MSVWFDRFLKAWASSGVVTDPSDAQANAGFAFLGAAPPTVELFNALEQYSDKKDTYLYNQMASVFAWGGQTANETNPNTLRDAIISKQRKVLTANTNYYIDIAGNDTTGDGTIGLPWKTLTHAYYYILSYIDVAGYTINLQLKSPGTYGPLNMNTPIRGTLTITGDKLNPRNYIVKNTAGPAIYASQGVTVFVQGLSVEGAGSAAPYAAAGFGIACDRAAVIFIDAVAFGVCSQSQIYAGESAVVWPANGTATNNFIYGSSPTFAIATLSGVVCFQNTTLTFQGVPAYSSSFLNVGIVGFVEMDNTIYSGSCTGQKYIVYLNGVLTTSNAGATIPGTIAGTVSSGGQIT